MYEEGTRVCFNRWDAGELHSRPDREDVEHDGCCFGRAWTAFHSLLSKAFVCMFGTEAGGRHNDGDRAAALSPRMSER